MIRRMRPTREAAPGAAPGPSRFSFRLMVGLGLAGLLILLLGLVQFLGFEPVGEHTGARATITGVHAYDAANPTAAGRDRNQFSPRETPAAAVDWGSLPPAMVVGGAWFTGVFAEPFGSLGPRPAGALVSALPVPVDRHGATLLPAGDYTFVVERYSGGQPVEVLARRTVIVSGG